MRLRKIYCKCVICLKKYGLKRFVKTTIKKITNWEERRYNQFRKKNRISSTELEDQSNTKFSFMPRLSIVVPLYRTPEFYLDSMIRSVKQQTYQNWELCLSDGSGKDFTLEHYIERAISNDKRIKVIYNSQTLKISDNTNMALTLCTGDYVAFMDHDDMLEPDALFRCVKCINDDLNIDIIYTDEDKVSSDNKKFFQPHFKPDFNRDLFFSMNYISHLAVVKRELLSKVGEMRAEYDGSQDYDFLLRCLDMTERVTHIPRVLYHWRSHSHSTAQGIGQKGYAVETGRKALQDYYNRNSIDAKVRCTEHGGIYRTLFYADESTKVSIIIPNKDHIGDLKKCLAAIEKKAGYNNYEILIIENNSLDEQTFRYYENVLSNHTNTKILYWKEEFNFSAINNWAVGQAAGELLLFLNNDIEWISDNFLKEMVSVAVRQDVGVVGSLLYFPNDIVQHAGVIIGYSGMAGHAFIGQQRGEPGYFSRILCMQNYSAVTAACMMTKRKVFNEVDRFDELFKIAFNDIDFCLKVRELGLLVVYDPYLEAYHYESKTRGSDEVASNKTRFEKEKELLKTKWGKYFLYGDPYYNKNLTLDRPDFIVK